MTLIIAEKKAVADSIASALPGTPTSGNGCIYLGDYAITWASGHLLKLKEPQDYDEALASWTLNALPIHFDNWQQKPDDSLDRGGKPSKLSRLKLVGELIKKADSVIHAGDPDEEGQLIVDEILRWFKYTGPVKRVATDDTTDEGLRKAFSHLTDNTSHMNEGWSAYARSVADLMVGVNLTRYFSLNNPATLTVGRVQTPTLGMVINRDMQIESHQKVFFYDVLADLLISGKVVKTKYIPRKDDPNLDDGGRILERSYAQSKADALAGQTIAGIQIKRKIDFEQPPLPFNTVKLQSYCSSHFGYDPTEVGSITQSLRDNHKAITYNRSDCQYLKDTHFDEAPATMDSVSKNIGFRPKTMDMTIRSKCFNEANVTAHHAIIPTNKRLDLSALSVQEKNVYLAICKYYMAQFMPPAQKERTGLSATLADGGRLAASSTKILDPGYLAIFKEAEKEEVGPLSELPEGTHSGDIQSTTVEQKETKPPARYTKATLNEDMTRIAKYVDDVNIKQMLIDKDKDKKGENGSIGTAATRPSIIDNLVARGFLEEKGKKIISTPLAREFFRILPDELKKPDMTAYWWVVQEDIRGGNATPDKLTGNVLMMIDRILNTKYPTINASVLPVSTKGGNKESLGACPRCGRPVIEGVKGFGCSGWKDGCKFTIWKTATSGLLSKTTFTKTDIIAFLAGKPVKKTKLVKKDGGTFEAHLKMKDDPTSQYGPSFDLEFSKTTTGKKGGRKKK